MQYRVDIAENKEVFVKHKKAPIAPNSKGMEFGL